MNRRMISLSAVTALAALVCAGCGTRNAPVPVQTASVPPAPQPSAAPAAFQPYQLIPQPAPKPRVVVKKKCVLHVVKRGKAIYLTDQSGRSFLAGRDQQGHLYPVYQSPETHQDYPVYYDPERDNYYREAQADNGQYYRNYVGDPSDEYYESDSSQPYPDYQPEIVDTDGTYYDDDGGNYYENDTPADDHQHHHHHDDWLWAVPIVVGAYFVLNQHHHDSSPNYQNDQNQHDQRPGIASGYAGSGANAPFGGNAAGRQPFPAATGPGQPGQSPVGNRPTFPATVGAAGVAQRYGNGTGRPTQGTATARQAVRPGTASRQGAPSSSGTNRTSGQRPGFPQASARPTATFGFPGRAGGTHQAIPPRRPVSSVTVRHFPTPTTRTAVRTPSTSVRRPFTHRFARVSSVTHSAAPVRRYAARTVRPRAASPRAFRQVPRTAVRRPAAVESRPGFSAARRPSLSYGSAPIRRAAPVPQRRQSFPSVSRPQVRSAPVPVRAAPEVRMRPAPSPPRPAAPQARQSAPPPRQAPARVAPAPAAKPR